MFFLLLLKFKECKFVCIDMTNEVSIIFPHQYFKNHPVIQTLNYNAYNIDPNWRKNEKVNRILLLEPSHFKKYSVITKVIDFIIDLSKNISGL